MKSGNHAFGASYTCTALLLPLLARTPNGERVLVGHTITSVREHELYIQRRLTSEPGGDQPTPSPIGSFPGGSACG